MLWGIFDVETFKSQCIQNQLPMNKQIKSFSTGMKARVQLLLALSHNAKLLILDEPTSGLDIISRDAMLELLRAYMETGNRAILISSHISSDLERFCDDIYMLHQGNIILHEDTDIMLDQYGLLKISNKDFEKLDKRSILYTKDEIYGKNCLTNNRQFYQDNYPEAAIEKGRLDSYTYNHRKRRGNMKGLLIKDMERKQF